MWPAPQFPVDLVAFTEEIVNGKVQFCAVLSQIFILIPLLPFHESGLMGKGVVS